MYARRFLTIVVAATLLVVAGAFAIFQFGGNLLLEQATPKGHFEAPSGGGAPVYADADLWVAKPGMRNDPALWRPDELRGVAEGGRAAVFYIHPTTYLDRDRWNASFRTDPQTEFRTRLFVQSQASAFNGVGEIWAPRYRQAAYGAFLLKTADAQKALSLAYMDVEAAFAEFLKEVPSDRPIILAGHSQGALHLARLLAQHRPEIGHRLVAAYVVGWPLSVTADLPPTGLPPCTRPDQAGCVLSWQTYGDPPNANFILDAWQGTKGRSGVRRDTADMLCVNPLTGTKDGAAPPNTAAGTLVPSKDFSTATLSNGLTAHCEKGLLILGGSPAQLGTFVLPGNNYHVYDYALFWGAIRADAARRLAAWRR
jgi:hypothetical protein